MVFDLQEKHELEEQRQALAEEVVKYRLKIKQLENDLLFRLSNSSVSLDSCRETEFWPAKHAAWAELSVLWYSHHISEKYLAWDAQWSLRSAIGISQDIIWQQTLPSLVSHLQLSLVTALQGNLLDDTELIDVLAVTKQTAQEVNERLVGASETNKKINEACEEYRPVARRATLCYFLIAEFSVVNCMYQTSLNQVSIAAWQLGLVLKAARILSFTRHCPLNAKLLHLRRWMSASRVPAHIPTPMSLGHVVLLA